MIDHILTSFQKATEKDCLETFSDVCLFPLRTGLGGKNIVVNDQTFDPTPSSNIIVRLFMTLIAFSVWLPMTLLGMASIGCSNSYAETFQKYIQPPTPPHSQPSSPRSSTSSDPAPNNDTGSSSTSSSSSSASAPASSSSHGVFDNDRLITSIREEFSAFNSIDFVFSDDAVSKAKGLLTAFKPELFDELCKQTVGENNGFNIADLFCAMISQKHLDKKSVEKNFSTIQYHAKPSFSLGAEGLLH